MDERDEAVAEERGSVRGEILRRFEVWLDETLSSEEPPSGAAAEILAEIEGGETADRANGPYGPYGLDALWSAMTALIQETKLQGRAFQKLHDTIASWTEEMGRERSAWKEEIAEARHHGRRDAVLALVDLRDRLARGIDAAGRHLERAESERRGRRWKLRFWLHGREREETLEAARALWKGSVLTLERLDEALSQFGVQEIDCLGGEFDPGIMKAVDVEETSAEREGEVLSVYRAGFEWNGELLRPAEVKV
ncbi:MAG: nucleotide exchange factor GrpE, partial [Vicinamibacteria bacterium]